MGYIRHHAIIVTGYTEEGIGRAHAKALEIFTSSFPDYRERELFCWVSPISPPAINGYQTFFVGPDGSKEGWTASDFGDDLRQKFIDWLTEDRDCVWALVRYYDEDRVIKIENSSIQSDEF